MKKYIGMLALIFAFSNTVSASAQHIESTSGPFGLMFVGTIIISGNQCSVDMQLDLSEKGFHTYPLYDSGYQVSATFTPNPSVACVGIEITDGDFDVISYNPSSNQGVIRFNNLKFLFGYLPCDTGDFDAIVTNMTSNYIGIEFNMINTSCGIISAYLYNTMYGLQITN